MATPTPKRAWATLLTRPSYLPGVLVLAHGLSKCSTIYPLIVLVTPSLPETSIQALETEREQNPLLLIRHVEPLALSGTTSVVAHRFTEVWTKLRVFELVECETVVYLDSDIAIRKNMDYLFDNRLPGKDWIAGSHDCKCNLTRDVSNCVYSSSVATDEGREIYINAGVFLFSPSESLSEAISERFTSPLYSEELSGYKFGDQDFINHFFKGRILPLGWQHNALKPLRYWHPDMWSDDEVCALHYVMDKPWNKRIASDGLAGLKGRDGETHKWWWDAWEEWKDEREGGEEHGEIMDMVEARGDYQGQAMLVAGELTWEEDSALKAEHAENRFPVPVIPKTRGRRMEYGQGRL